MHLDWQRTWQPVAVLSRGPEEWPWLQQRPPSGAGVCWGKPRCDPRASGHTARAETTWQEGVSTTETRGSGHPGMGKVPTAGAVPKGVGVPNAPLRSSAWAWGGAAHPWDTHAYPEPGGPGLNVRMGRSEATALPRQVQVEQAGSHNRQSSSAQHQARWPEAGLEPRKQQWPLFPVLPHRSTLFHHPFTWKTIMAGILDFQIPYAGQQLGRRRENQGPEARPPQSAAALLAHVRV